MGRGPSPLAKCPARPPDYPVPRRRLLRSFRNPPAKSCCHQVLAFAWTLNPWSPLEVFVARSPAERVPACKPMICLTRLDQFTPVHDVRLGLVPFKYAIQKPNNETVRQQNEHAHQTRPMPEMTDF